MKKCVVGGLVCMLIALSWGGHSWGEQIPAPRGELRIVDKHPLNWASIVYNVFEHLMELDKDGTAGATPGNWVGAGSTTAPWNSPCARG